MSILYCQFSLLPPCGSIKLCLNFHLSLLHIYDDVSCPVAKYVRKKNIIPQTFWFLISTLMHLFFTQHLLVPYLTFCDLVSFLVTYQCPCKTQHAYVAVCVKEQSLLWSHGVTVQLVLFSDCNLRRPHAFQTMHNTMTNICVVTTQQQKQSQKHKLCKAFSRLHLCSLFFKTPIA